MHYAFRQSLIETVTKSLEEIANKKTQQIEDFIKEKLLDIHVLAESPMLIADFKQIIAETETPLPPPRLQRFKTRLRKAYSPYIDQGQYNDFYLIAPNGTILFSYNLRGIKTAISKLGHIAKLSWRRCLLRF